MVMIQTDPEFYRKVVALNQITTRKLKITVSGDSVRFYISDKHVGDMNSGLFFKLTPSEILKTIGVSNEHRKSWLT
jgi:hypothetical protein|tara:strand:- start:216 stop:443 length:228 start_codon:yes stop_codon:yes gene_type:complete